MVAKNSFFLNQPAYGLSTNRGVGNRYDLISALVIQRHSDHDASKEATNPLWSWIHWFFWWTMLRVILYYWSWLRSPQRGATFEYISSEDTIKRVQLRSLPCIALRIPTAHNFSTRIKKMAAFSLWLWFVDTINRNGCDPGRLALVVLAVYYSLRLACYFPPVSLVFPTISLWLAQKALWLAYSVSSYKIVRVTLYSFKIFGFQQPARW